MEALELEDFDADQRCLSSIISYVVTSHGWKLLHKIKKGQFEIRNLDIRHLSEKLPKSGQELIKRWGDGDVTKTRHKKDCTLKKSKLTSKQIFHAEFQTISVSIFFHCLNTRRVTRHNNTTPYLLSPEPYPDCHLRI